MNIYFICTGNTCRSPMAEAILKAQKVQGIEVRSAGVYALPGSDMSINAQAVLNQQQIEHQHSAKMVQEDELAWAHLILTMTKSHKELLLRDYPKFADKTFTLKEYVDATDGLDVQDPYGGSVATYESTFNELQRLIAKFVAHYKEDPSS